MRTTRAQRTGHSATRRAFGAATIVAVALLVAACQPVTFGNPGAQVGNAIDPVSCPGHEAVPTSPCGPQPMLWASMIGPYGRYEDGDPHSTHCAPGGGSGTACTQGNASYRPSGYAYAIDVGAGDVGTPLTLQAYDIGLYPRRVGNAGASAPPERDIDDLVTVAGSSTVTSATAAFTAADQGKRIFAVSGVPASSIQSVTSATTAVLANSATRSGTTAASIGYDCNTAQPPFNTAELAGIGTSNCQTADDTDIGGQDVDVQVYDANGSGAASYDAPLAGCHFSHSAAELSATPTAYKNTWIEICTFTPAKKGIYAFRVRNSGIDGMTDTGSGTNNYALRVVGGTVTKLHALDDQDVFLQPVGPTTTVYLADVPKDDAGKKLLVDVYDPGDWTGVDSTTVQVKAPPGGAPAAAPSGAGAVVPAAGIATACRYNAIPSDTVAPATPDVATDCAVTTHTIDGNLYNGKWLRVEITLDPAYTCTTDCWWTMEWNWRTTTPHIDHVMVSAKVA